MFQEEVVMPKEKKAKKNKTDAKAAKPEKPGKAKKGAITGASVMVLGPGEAAYARLEEGTGTLSLGLPRGEKGERGPAGPPGRARPQGGRRIAGAPGAGRTAGTAGEPRRVWSPWRNGRKG